MNMKMHSDDALVEQIRLGNEAAAEELINRYYASILRYCRRHCLNVERAEVYGSVAVNEAHHGFMRVALQLLRYLGEGPNVVVPGVSLIEEHRVISPDGLISPDLLERRDNDLTLVGDVLLDIPPVWGDGVLEVILEGVQLVKPIHHRRGVLSPEYDTVYAVGRE